MITRFNSVWGSALLLAGTTFASAQNAVPIPFDQIGAVAGQQRAADALAVKKRPQYPRLTKPRRPYVDRWSRNQRRRAATVKKHRLYA